MSGRAKKLFQAASRTGQRLVAAVQSTRAATQLWALLLKAGSRPKRTAAENFRVSPAMASLLEREAHSRLKQPHARR